MELDVTDAAQPSTAILAVPDAETGPLQLSNDAEIDTEERSAGHAAGMNVPPLVDHVADRLALAATVGDRNAVGVSGAHSALG
ncbi:MAG: hypothetical protein Q8J89_09530 [Caulobacter sp.]|nr:hypothetical protein [Caulobacter sp.]